MKKICVRDDCNVQILDLCSLRLEFVIKSRPNLQLRYSNPAFASACYQNSITAAVLVKQMSFQMLSAAELNGPKLR